MSEAWPAALAAGLLALAGCSGPAQASPAAATIAACRSGPPEAGVHNPDRLEVLERCARVEGVVLETAREDDGDVHVWIAPDTGFERLLNAEDHYQARPALLTEIIPGSSIPVPRIGEHVAVTGPWVLDKDHGWREIHPVDSLARLG